MIRNVRQSILKNLHPSLNFKHSISLFSTLPCYKTDQITELCNNFTNSVDISVNLFFHNFVFVKRTINFTLALLLFKQNTANLRHHLGGLGRHLLLHLLLSSVPSCSSSSSDILGLTLFWKLALLYKPFNS